MSTRNVDHYPALPVTFVAVKPRDADVRGDGGHDNKRRGSGGVIRRGRKSQLDGAWSKRDDLPRRSDGFITHFTDTYGRNYMVINNGPTFDDYTRRGDIDLRTWVDPQLYLMDHSSPSSITANVNLGTQLMVMRLPPAKRDTPARDLPHPEVDNGRIVATHRDSGRICHIHYGPIIWKPGNRKGTLVCERFVVTQEKK